MSTAIKRHPFSYTLGPGPYKWVGSYNLGAVIACLHAGNIDGYNNGLAMAPKVEEGMGTCAHCGHAVLLIQIVETGEGKRFGVGSDCILKTAVDGDFTNISEFERKLRLVKRQKAKEQRERLRAKKAGELKQLLDENETRLRGLPHPSEFHRAKNKTAYDYCEFVYAKGKVSVGGIKTLILKLHNWGIGAKK